MWNINKQQIVAGADRRREGNSACRFHGARRSTGDDSFLGNILHSLVCCFFVCPSSLPCSLLLLLLLVSITDFALHVLSTISQASLSAAVALPVRMEQTSRELKGSGRWDMLFPASEVLKVVWPMSVKDMNQAGGYIPSGE